MKQAILYGAAGGALAGLLLGIGFFMFTDIPEDGIIAVGSEASIRFGHRSSGAAWLLLPFIAAGAVLGVFSAYFLSFSLRELDPFLAVLRTGLREYRGLVAGLCLAGGALALWLGGLPVSPGLYPYGFSGDEVTGDEVTGESPALGDARAPEDKAAPPSPEDQWRAIETLQNIAIERRQNRNSANIELGFTKGFFAGLTIIQGLLLFVFGATTAGWSALVCAAVLASRRAGGEALFWSLWLLSGGFFLGVVAVGGFGYVFQAFPDSDAEIYVYSILNAGIPGAWVTFCGAAGNTVFGLLGFEPRWRSALAGLVASLNVLALLVLGTTTRLTLALKSVEIDVDDSTILPNPVWFILTYFEGHLVDPDMMSFPTAPLTAIVTSLGLGLIIGGTCYGTNVTLAKRRDDT